MPKTVKITNKALVPRAAVMFVLIVSDITRLRKISSGIFPISLFVITIFASLTPSTITAIDLIRFIIVAQYNNNEN
jgi:hypothetical protein